MTNKVTWPHEYILGGLRGQHVTFDQLNLTQFVNGFVKGVLDERDESVREKMLYHLCDLMENANDFSWASAKASHAVLLCEMERGTVDWSDTLTESAELMLNVTLLVTKRVGFETKTIRVTIDHDLNSKTHKHICAFCQTQGRHMTHPVCQKT